MPGTLLSFWRCKLVREAAEEGWWRKVQRHHSPQAAPAAFGCSLMPKASALAGQRCDAAWAQPWGHHMRLAGMRVLSPTHSSALEKISQWLLLSCEKAQPCLSILKSQKNWSLLKTSSCPRLVICSLPFTLGTAVKDPLKAVFRGSFAVDGIVSQAMVKCCCSVTSTRSRQNPCNIWFLSSSYILAFTWKEKGKAWLFGLQYKIGSKAEKQQNNKNNEWIIFIACSPSKLISGFWRLDSQFLNVSDYQSSHFSSYYKTIFLNK